jgi:hypothetical protein
MRLKEIKTIKQQVFSEILELGVKSPMFVDEKEVKNVFTKKLDLDFQLYGERLSFVKNVLEEKVGEAKYAKDISKTRYDIAKKQIMFGRVVVKNFAEVEDGFKRSDTLHRTWKFFHGVSKDKWDLLNKSFNHVRGCITTLRTELAKGVTHG